MKMVLRSLAALVVVLGALAGSARATSVTYDFENAKASDFSPLQGKGSTGSALSVSEEKPHDGQRSLKLDYRNSGGYLEFYPLRSDFQAFEGDKLYVSFWIWGDGQKAFSSGAMRLVDHEGEAFHFPLPELGRAASGQGWSQVRAELDLTKYYGSWGDRKDGKLQRPFAWLGFALDVKTTPDAPITGTLYLDQLTLSDTPILETPVAAAPKLNLEPIAGTEDGEHGRLTRWWFAPGTPVRFRASVNRLAGAQAQRMAWRAFDANNLSIAQGEAKLAEGTANPTCDITVPAPPRGVLYLSATLLNAKDEVLAKADSRAAVWEPFQKPTAVRPMVWGISAHLGGLSEADARDHIRLIRSLGFSTCRFDLTWQSIQPAEGEWNWKKYDFLTGKLRDEGIALAPILSYTAKWASTAQPGSAGDPTRMPPRTEPWLEYVRRSVERYKAFSPAWEIWNEPDIGFWNGTVEQYAALVDATVPVIQAAQPGANILNGGFSETKRRPDFIPKYLQLVSNRPETLAVHSHQRWENTVLVADTTAHLLSERQLTGAKKPLLWLNEAGYSNFRGVPEMEQARQLVKKMTYAAGSGFEGYFVYDLVTDGEDPNEIEHNFGLFRRDLSPKAGGLAVANLLRHLDGKKPEGRLGGSPEVYAFIFRGKNPVSGEDESTLVAWRKSGGQSSTLPVLFSATGDGKIRAISSDLFGNETPVETSGGAFLLAVGDEPRIVTVSAQTRGAAAPGIGLPGRGGMLLDLPATLVLAPAEEGRLNVRLVNPLRTPMRGTVQAGDGQAERVDIPAGGSKEVSFTVRGGAKSGEHTPVPVSLQLDGWPPLQGTTELRTAYGVPPQPESLGISLGRDRLVSLFEATPMQELHFSGEDDLEAKAELVRSTEGVAVTVKVTDQRHVPEAAADAWWNGDSLQWAVAKPDGSFWEWTAALLPGGAKARVTSASDGKVGAEFPVVITREGNLTIYRFTLPAVLPDGSKLPARFGFNFLVNDNDGAGRKGWLEWSPGIGLEKNPALFNSLSVGAAVPRTPG